MASTPKLIDFKSRKPYLLVLIILTVSFIFINSMLDKAQSGEESNAVLDFIRPILELIVGKGNVTSHLVRKLAHFGEFALLGCEVFFYFMKPKLIIVYLLLLTALSDETIQIFSGRGPLVQDVWLDYFGACTGYFMSFAIYKLAVLIISKKKSAFTE